jgi:hypothetical protein
MTESAESKTVREPQRTTPRRSRSGSETRARSQLVNVRIDADERIRWTAFAQSKGMSLAGLLRLSVEAAILQDQIAEAHRG